MTAVSATSIPRERTFVAPRVISIRDDFVARKGAEDRAHVRTLAQAVANQGPLDPVLLWRDGGTLVLLDGAYRLAAYKAAGWNDPIPAIIVLCDRRTALLLAAKANVKDKLSLTPTERADLAWKLVREPGMDFSKPEIARATGVSTATVARMRARLKVLLGMPEVEITGHWWRDRADEATEGVERDQMSEAERRKVIEEIAKQLRNVLDWRRPGAKTADSSIVYAALYEALGVQSVRFFVDWSFGGMAEEAEEWGSFGIGDEEEDDDAEADTLSHF